MRQIIDFFVRNKNFILFLSLFSFSLILIFSNSRYTGMDRIGDQKFVSIGLNLMSMNMSMDKLMFFLGKKIYFEDPKNKIGAMSPNTKNNSPIVFMTNYKTNNNFNFRLYTGLRSKDERVLLGGADISKKYKSFITDK